MVASQFVRVDMETKQALEIFKNSEWEPFGEVIKRLIFIVLGYEEESLNPYEKKGILKAINAVKKGKTQSFEEMMKNIQKKRASKGVEDKLKEGRSKDASES